MQRKNKSLWLFRRQPVRIEGRHGDHRRNRIVSVTLQKPHRRAKPFHPRHEMTHLWQHHFGKPSRAGYHNKEWAAKMHAIGLHPSDIGRPGGKETGQSCSHYIIERGPYARAFAELAGQSDFSTLYIELWDDAEARKKRKAKSASKTRYTCPSCDQHAWAKLGAKLICGDCDEPMSAD
ncbi:sprT domain-containing protein [Mesorhizobium sp. M0276]|uniref:sprT domain-containing protein n=1 Tax=Mesorhizobium sp. M0276 TaxID=2956928 RepID=UPI00333B7B7D